MIFIAVPFALVVGYLWLRGGWTTPALLTVAYVAFCAVATTGINLLTCFYLALIWVPFMVRRVTGSRLPSIGGSYRVMAAVERR